MIAWAAGNPLDLKGKRVLVVGIGNSAVDIVSELGLVLTTRARAGMPRLVLAAALAWPRRRGTIRTSSCNARARTRC